MKAVVALGANIGNPCEQMDLAVALLREATEVIAVSSYFVTKPVGGPEQPDYLNAVAIIDSELPALDLLHLLQGIEKSSAVYMLYDADKLVTDAWKPTCGVEYRDMSLDKSVLAAWADSHPDETAFIEAYSIPTAQVNRLLAFYEDESDGDMELTAKEYLKSESDWTKWVPADVAKKVKAAL